MIFQIDEYSAGKLILTPMSDFAVMLTLVEAMVDEIMV